MRSTKTTLTIYFIRVALGRELLSKQFLCPIGERLRLGVVYERNYWLDRLRFNREHDDQIPFAGVAVFVVQCFERTNASGNALSDGLNVVNVNSSAN